MTQQETIDFIKNMIKGRIKDIERRLEQLPENNVKIEYEQNYLGRKFAYEDVLNIITDYLETPFQ